ncbi:MAG TPA: UDP-2,3-diacylglucosamine diphosphatase LpxI [Planctomycetia bacterium]|nr:UDP-2,3-diacylglucosamine diphosphatase LpxI [Planctomycetia bacterium]
MSGARTGGRVGLLAGGGRFPAAFAQAARAQGLEVVCVAIRHHADGDLLRPLVDRFHWTALARFGRTISLFRREGVGQVVMAGKIQKVALFGPWRWLRLFPDWRTVRFWLDRRRRDNRDDSLLLGVIKEFARDGIAFSSALEVCPELLVKPGTLTRRAPTPAERRDIAFGWSLAKEMGRLDVGQSVAVKDRAVLAVEAIEGTDRAILRAGELCAGGGFTVVKVAKPQQDMRFDVPTVGVTTIENLAKAGGKTLAVEADKTILLDAAETIEAAERLGIALVSLTAEQALETDLRQAG